MALDTLLGERRAIFGSDYYLRQPFALAGAARSIVELGNWELIDSMLASDAADVLIVREGEQRPQSGRLDPQQARALFDEGYTLVLRHGECCEPRLAALAAEVAQELDGPVDVHLYATPAGRSGFRWHYDAEEVFILQAQGVKEYSLRKNTVNPWPVVEALPANMQYEREIMPLVRCRLAAGDWLYIPNGYWHLAEAKEASISLAIGVLAPTALGLFDSLRPRLLDSLLWRQRLPSRAFAVSEADWLDQCRAVFTSLRKDLERKFSAESAREVLLARLADSQNRQPMPTRPDQTEVQHHA